MVPYIKWIYACMILHNMLGNLQDSWDTIDSDLEASNAVEENAERVSACENVRAWIKKNCLTYHHQGPQ